ncbi:hypothetical protein NDU88_007376 [Pleurodeles waltl]|uniref:Uncharacterized protein n=1 Tax=Pleurodeles waltl TaxID=8319 RepID=A0AAV7NSX3_PLEWA|nr:hypothetical protein NDU88_007376 [Pleurodeles waltl]
MPDQKENARTYCHRTERRKKACRNPVPTDDEQKPFRKKNRRCNQKESRVVERMWERSAECGGSTLRPQTLTTEYPANLVYYPATL